ncbi:MAG TPA: class I SAM-dependent methyltransferase [Ilumatobacteraceae bacterium]|nr:class I SAM-dependent methyltransferase [Ilumatobacteraceae bacterium]
MEGYHRSSYGDAFADVYDDWYPGAEEADVTAALVAELVAGTAAADPGRVLELAVGTGRLALPLAARGLHVHGVDASAAMLERLRARDPDGTVTVHLGDMVDDLPAGPFDVVLVAYNSLFNLESAERQAACFGAVAARLAPAGVFLVEAFVPEDPPREGTVVDVRNMTATEVVLSISTHDPVEQRAAGHFVSFTDGAAVRLRPWAIRYAGPDELDAMAAAAGLATLARWEGADRRPFTPDSPRHVTVYGRPRDGRNKAT